MSAENGTAERMVTEEEVPLGVVFPHLTPQSQLDVQRVLLSIELEQERKARQAAEAELKRLRPGA